MGKKILVVDDDPVILEMLSSGLKQNGYDVSVAKGGKEAVRAVRKRVPDLVILDILMPDMDGTEVARIIKEDIHTRHVAIIFLTVLKGNEDQVVGQPALDPIVILGKPLKLDELLEKIHSLIG